MLIGSSKRLNNQEFPKQTRMLKAIEKLLISASVVGVSAIATAPASAASLTGATIGGTAASDSYVYDVSGSSTVVVSNTPANVQKVLGGNAGSPTGNVELRASTEKVGFDFTKNTSLTGNIGGQSITLSSLTESDWFGAGPKTYGQSNFANTWFNNFITKAGYGNFVGTGFAANMYNSFFSLGGFQASSDPNISYVNQDDNTGEIKIGLAGHYDLKAAYGADAKYKGFAAFLPNGFQASEVVKYTYNGKTDYLYSFVATATGLSAGDTKRSHSGNYEVSFAGVKQSVPEPSAMLGLISVGGFLVGKRKMLKKA